MKPFTWAVLVLLALPVIALTQNASTSKDEAAALKTSGSAPTLSACGTSPTVTGNNYAGRVTVGTGLVASCTVTFVPAFTVAPVCVTSMTNAAEVLQATTTTTTLVITGSDITSNILAYICAQVP